MKIFFIANVRFPTERAHGVHIAKMCDALAERFGEQNVTLILPRRRNSAYTHTDPAAYYRLKYLPRIVRLPVIDLFFLPFFKRFAFRFETCTFALSALWYCAVLKLSMRKKLQLLVFCRDEVSAFIATLFFPGRVIFEMHQFFAGFQNVYRRLGKKCAYIAVLTEGLRSQLLATGVTAEIRSVPDAVSLDDFNTTHFSAGETTLRQSYAIPSTARIVLYHGSLYQWKGVYTLADSIQFLPETVWIVIIGGVGKEYEQLRQYCTDRGYTRIVCIPAVPYAAIPQYIAQADVGVLPNRSRTDSSYTEQLSDRYTSPLKVFEFLAAHVPVIATATHAHRELLNTNQALFVEPNSAYAIAEGVLRILNEPALRDTLVRNGYAFVERHTWNKRIETMIAGYV